MLTANLNLRMSILYNINNPCGIIALRIEKLCGNLIVSGFFKRKEDVFHNLIAHQASLTVEVLALSS